MNMREHMPAALYLLGQRAARPRRGLLTRSQMQMGRSMDMRNAAISIRNSRHLPNFRLSSDSFRRTPEVPPSTTGKDSGAVGPGFSPDVRCSYKIFSSTEEIDCWNCVLWAGVGWISAKKI